MLEPKGIKNKNLNGEFETETELESSPEPVSTFWTPPKIKALISLIIAMSFVLAIGFGFFVFKLVTSLLKPQSGTVGDAAKLISQDEGHKERISKDLSIQSAIKLNGFKIQQITANDKELILLMSKRDKEKNKDQSQIWILNKKTKTITSKVKLIDQ